MAITRAHYASAGGVSMNAKNPWIFKDVSTTAVTTTTPTQALTSLDMLARFQQKQLQEKEQKLLQLYDQQQQRAHQVAQRGSAGSGGTHAPLAGIAFETRQMLGERRTARAKGIDKSYPLEPLESRAGRKSTSQAQRAQVNTAKRAPHRVGKVFNGGNVDGYTYSGDTCENPAAAAAATAYGNNQRSSPGAESIRERQHERRYEINIDEVIDNEAMERNRMLAKFHSVDTERQRFPDENNKNERLFSESKKSIDRKSFQEEGKTERLKNTITGRNNASPLTRKYSDSVNNRPSTLMKMTKSASLKIRKLLRNKKKLEKKKSNAASESKLRKQSESKDRKLGKSLSPDLNPLKSTSLICDIIRNNNKSEQDKSQDNIGKVKAIILKIESRTTQLSSSSRTSSGDVNAIEQNSSNESKIIENTETSGKDTFFEKISKIVDNNEDNELTIPRKEIKASIIREINVSSIDEPTDSQEIIVTDQVMKIESLKINDQLLDKKYDFAKTSFETKRNTLERTISQEDSTKSHSVEWTSIKDINREIIKDTSNSTKTLEKDKKNSTKFPAAKKLNVLEKSKDDVANVGSRLCTEKFAKKDEKATSHRRSCKKGFERDTSSWSIKISKLKKNPRKKSFLIRKVSTTVKNNGKSCPVVLKKSARVYGKTIRQNEDKKLKSDPKSNSSAKKSIHECVKLKNDQNQSFLRNAKNKEPLNKGAKTRARVDKNKIVYSTTRTTSTDYALKKKNTRTLENTSRKNGMTNSKSFDKNYEQDEIPATKSSSRKFLNRLVESNADATPTTAENGLALATRKLSISATSEPDSSNSTVNKKAISSISSGAARTASPLSSSSSLATNRSQNSSGSRAHDKFKTSNAASNPTAATNSDSLTTCKICKRRFTAERITLHEQICAKTAQKKRKQFDTVTQRVKGTELESFVLKPNKKGKNAKASSTAAAAAAAAAAATNTSKSNWRRKHEDFINAIRSAKQVQAHLAKGGKLSDLPPPPASDTSDYVQCPHCSRKFNQAAAERHIPKCETMLHNKPNLNRSLKSRR